MSDYNDQIFPAVGRQRLDEGDAVSTGESVGSFYVLDQAMTETRPSRRPRGGAPPARRRPTTADRSRSAAARVTAIGLLGLLVAFACSRGIVRGGPPYVRADC